jgi:hypothetical protein
MPVLHAVHVARVRSGDRLQHQQRVLDADSLRRKVIAPLLTWLRTPINASRQRDVNANPPRSRLNKS